MKSVLPLTIKNTIRALKRSPIVWMPGIYAGCVAALVIWLEFTGGVFLAGKVAMLAAIVFPFFLSILNYHLETDEDKLKMLLTIALRGYFPIILPIVVLLGFAIVLAILLSIPLSFMGYGDNPNALTGLMLGIFIPVALLSIYIDNVAVCERTKVFSTLSRCFELVTGKIITAIWFFVISGIVTIFVTLLGAFLWGVMLADRFASFATMNMTMQQEVFSGYTLADWQNLIGPEGTIVTALVFGFVTFLLVPFLCIFKYECYLDALDVVWNISFDSK